MRERMHEPIRFADALERESPQEGPMPLGALVAGARERAADATPGPADTVESAEDAEVRRQRQRVARESVWRARLPRRYATASLDALRPQQNPVMVRAWLAATVGGEPNALNLLLAGPSRRGKTFAVYALGNAYVADGGHAVSWTLADLNAALRPDGDPTAYDRVTTVGLLVLDDVGREQVSAWTLEQFQRILDHRNREGLRTAMTTNLVRASLTERYGEPIVARMLDDCRVLRVDGDPIDGGETTW
jgi:DNA replication protein DnaC